MRNRFLKHAFVGIGVVELVLAVVIEEDLVGFREEILPRFSSIVGCESSADEG